MRKKVGGSKKLLTFDEMNSGTYNGKFVFLQKITKNYNELNEVNESTQYLSIKKEDKEDKYKVYPCEYTQNKTYFILTKKDGKLQLKLNARLQDNTYKIIDEIVIIHPHSSPLSYYIEYYSEPAQSVIKDFAYIIYDDESKLNNQ